VAIAAEAVAPEAAAAESAGWRAVSQASGQLRRAPAAARAVTNPVRTPSAALQTLTRLVWAAAVAFVVLELVAEATGQVWDFTLPTTGRAPQPVPYQPLYAGQAMAQAHDPVGAVIGAASTGATLVSGGAALVAP